MIKPNVAVHKLEARMRASDSLLCVGLDPDLVRIGETTGRHRSPVVDFCCNVIDQTAEFACAFKLNTAFFEEREAQGWYEMEEVMRYLRERHADLFTICDAKRGDIGNTNRGYAAAVFDRLRADAITLHPYLGAEAMEPFLARETKVSIILCRTSNPGAGEFQDLLAEGRPLWQHVAERVSRSWNSRGNCMLVVGATWPEEMRRIRVSAPEMTFLVPGIGAQGGDIEATIHAGIRPDGLGLILSSSRAILYAQEPAGAARATRDAINQARRRVHASR